MSDFNVKVEGGTAVRLPTAGKYCERDIVIEASKSGIDTSDATIVPSDMREGTVGYARGERLVGTAKVAYGGISAEITPEMAGGMPYVRMRYTVQKPTYISPDYGADINLQSPLEAFGNLLPEDVPVGKTFTSVAGLLVEGTKTESGSGEDPSLPKGYMRAGFIRFTGAQIVDTRIIPTQDTKIRILFTREVSNAMYLYGVTSSDNTKSVTAYLSSGGSWRFGNKSAGYTVTVNPDLIQTAIVDKTGIIRPNTLSTFSSVNDFEAVGSLLIGGGRNANGTVGVASYIGNIPVIQMWQGETEVLHLISLVSTDGIYRFYDTVSKAFFDSITDTPLEGGNL